MRLALACPSPHAAILFPCDPAGQQLPPASRRAATTSPSPQHYLHSLPRKRQASRPLLRAAGLPSYHTVVDEASWLRLTGRRGLKRRSTSTTRSRQLGSRFQRFSSPSSPLPQPHCPFSESCRHLHQHTIPLSYSISIHCLESRAPLRLALSLCVGETSTATQPRCACTLRPHAASCTHTLHPHAAKSMKTIATRLWSRRVLRRIWWRRLLPSACDVPLSSIRIASGGTTGDLT